MASSLQFLLQSAWKAECALHKFIPTTGQFPAAYFSYIFSARAVMLVDGIDTANEQKIQVVANRWVEKGLYGPSTREYNPLLDLFRNRPYVAERPSIKLSTALANTIQQRLIQKVNAIAIIHETYILERLGGAAYLSIVNSLAPTAEFLFVRERACQLLEQLTEVKL